MTKSDDLTTGGVPVQPGDPGLPEGSIKIEWGICTSCGMTWTLNSLNDQGRCMACMRRAEQDAERAANTAKLMRDAAEHRAQLDEQQPAPLLREALRKSEGIELRDQLLNFFTYHQPRPDQLPRYERIRSALLECAQVLVDCTPPGADQTYAVRLLRMAGMTANAAIACGESGEVR